jgi:hypothetical protein
LEEYGLSDGQSTDARDRSVDACVILIYTNNRLHHFWRRLCRVRVKVHHRAAKIAQRYGNGGRVVPFAEAEHAAQPLVFLERARLQ